MVGGFEVGVADGEVSPGLVEAEGVQAVVEVVTLADGGEHCAYAVVLVVACVGVAGEVGFRPCRLCGVGMVGHGRG